MNASGYSGDKFRVLCNNKRSFSLFTLLQGGDITRIVGTKSRFNPSAHPILESSDAKKNYFLSVEDVAGESRMKELQSELDETKKAINNLEAEHSNYSGKQLNLRQQCQDIRQKRSLCQHEIKRVGLLDRDLATEQRRRNDIEKQLSKSAEAERISLRNTLRTEVREYGTSLSSFNSIAHQRIDLTVVHTVTSENLRIFRGKLAAASSELAASREALEDFRSDVLIARNARDGLKEDFKVLEKILEQIEQKCGGEKIFGQVRHCLLFRIFSVILFCSFMQDVFWNALRLRWRRLNLGDESSLILWRGCDGNFIEYFTVNDMLHFCLDLSITRIY